MAPGKRTPELLLPALRGRAAPLSENPWEADGRRAPAASRAQSGAQTAPPRNARRQARAQARRIRAKQGPAPRRRRRDDDRTRPPTRTGGDAGRKACARRRGPRCRLGGGHERRPPSEARASTGGRARSARIGPPLPFPLPRAGGYRIHTSAPGVVALHYPNRRPGPRAGAQPRFSRQPRIAVRGRPWRSGLLSTGCGGIGSQGWVPAFAGTTKRGRKPAQQGQQARRRQAGMRCVHAVGPRSGAHLRPFRPA